MFSWFRVTAVALYALASPAGAATGDGGAAEDTPAAFVERFEAAFRSGELAAAVPLFCWNGVPAPSREAVRVLIERDLGRTLLDTAWLPPPREPRGPALSRGRLLRSNLPVVARFAARFVDEFGVTHVSLHDVGIEDGRFYIALVEPVPIRVRAVPRAPA